MSRVKETPVDPQQPLVPTLLGLQETAGNHLLPPGTKSQLTVQETAEGSGFGFVDQRDLHHGFPPSELFKAVTHKQEVVTDEVSDMTELSQSVLEVFSETASLLRMITSWQTGLGLGLQLSQLTLSTLMLCEATEVMQASILHRLSNCSFSVVHNIPFLSNYLAN